MQSEARRATRLAAILTLLVCVTGIVGIRLVAKYELWRRSLFYEQFAAIEAPGIAIIAAFAIGILVMLRRPPPIGEIADTPRWLDDTRVTRAALTAGVLIVTLIGTHLVFGAYPFVDDEFSGLFQGIIYSRGERVAVVPDPWCRWIGPMTPTSIVVSAPCTWQLGYFPVHAMIRGLFDALRVSSLAEPVMAALSVLLIFLTARRAWPDQRRRAVVAALFLAASTQFLVTSMSAFSMPAHLLASVAWLWLYVRPERWALIALPWLGVIALGVHSPYPHMLFVAPLVLSFLFRRRYGAFVYVSVVYVIGSLAWLGRLYPSSRVAASPLGDPGLITGTAVSIATSPAGDGMTGAMSVAVLATWNVPIALLCVLVAMLLWNRLDGFSRWLALSLVFTVAARAIFFGTYGAGWGNRYAFAVLGNVALLAALGAEAIGEAVGQRRGRQLLVAALLTALCLQLPMRGVQASRIVKPYRDASRYLEQLPAEVVVVPFETIQWGRQLLRNDPFLRNSPKLMSFAELGSGGVDSLEALFPGRVKLVAPEELQRFGIKRATRIGRFEIR